MAEPDGGAVDAAMVVLHGEEVTTRGSEASWQPSNARSFAPADASRTGARDALQCGGAFDAPPWEALMVRALVPEDAAAFRELRIRALREHPEAFGRTPDEVDSVEIWKQRLADDATSDLDFMVGAFDDDVLVGVAGCHRERFIKQRHIAHIWGVYVSAEHRNRGLGRALCTAVIERARAWPDLESIWLDVTTSNHTARALYVSCGFETVATKPRCLRVGDRYYDEELMALDLRKPAPHGTGGHLDLQ
jgi:RimJ/RimL family protein N-acetyltransferase